MSEPLLGEIRAFGFNFAPRGWAFCDGQLLAINQNQALFALLGTTYGGDGRTTFALPDLRSRVVVGEGSGPGLSTYPLGSEGGAESVTLTTEQLAAHGHAVGASNARGRARRPGGRFLSRVTRGRAYGPEADVELNAATVAPAGGDQPHLNVQPYVTLNYCIAVQGLFPSRN